MKKMYREICGARRSGWVFVPDGTPLRTREDMQRYVQKLDDSMLGGQCARTLLDMSVRLLAVTKSGMDRSAVTSVCASSRTIRIAIQPSVLHRSGEVGNVQCNKGVCAEHLLFHEFLHVLVICIQMEWRIAARDWAHALVVDDSAHTCAGNDGEAGDSSTGDAHCLFFWKLLQMFSTHQTIDNTLFAHH